MAGIWGAKQRRLIELERMWQAVLADWAVEIQHDAFISACVVSGQAQFASRRYHGQVISMAAEHDVARQAEAYRYLLLLERSKNLAEKARSAERWGNIFSVYVCIMAFSQSSIPDRYKIAGACILVSVLATSLITSFLKRRRQFRESREVLGLRFNTISVNS